MTRLYFPKTKDRAIAGVLADVAHELSGASNWEEQVRNVLYMLYDLIQTDSVILGINFNGWRLFRCSSTDDSDDDIEMVLLQHYSALTGKMPIGNTNAWDKGIRQRKGENGSYLSLPVIGSGKVLGVLHIRTDQEDAYSADDASLVSVVALQIGSFLSSEQAHINEVAAREKLEQLARNAEHRSAELESFLYSVGDGIIVYDTDSNVVIMNDVGKAILEVPPDMNVDWSKIRRYTLDGKYIPEGQSAVSKAFHGEVVKGSRYKAIMPWGKEALVSVSASPIRDSQCQIIGVTIVFRDISSEVEIEQNKQELFDREHNIAQALQEALIPSQIDYTVQDFRIAVRYQAALREAEIGGDFYDVFKMDDGMIGILIGDVVGKGLQAAIRVAAVRYSVRSYAYLDASPAVVITLVNDALCRDESESTSMLTAFFAVLNPDECTITYVNAGHEPPLLYSNKGEISELNSGGRVLGVLPDFAYTEESLSLQMGDMLIVVTDGITEARSNNVLFELEGIKRFLKSNRKLNPHDTAIKLLESAVSHAGGTLQDDAAIVVIKKETQNSPGCLDSQQYSSPSI